LSSQFYGSLCGRVKEKLGSVGGILSLDEAVQLSILWGRLAENTVPVRRRIGRKIRGSVLFGLPEGNGSGNHGSLLSVQRLQVGSIDNTVRKVLLIALGAGSK